MHQNIGRAREGTTTGSAATTALPRARSTHHRGIAIAQILRLTKRTIDFPHR